MTKEKAQEIVERLSSDIFTYLEDALAQDGDTPETNEWLAQIKSIADAAYGEGNY